MLVCNHCGKVISEEELEWVKEPYGKMVAAPCERCGGDFVEATECEVCGEWFDNCEGHGICEVCFDEYETYEDAVDIGKEDLKTVKVELNGFTASVLTPDKIAEILDDWVAKNYANDKTAIVKYCESDMDYFTNWILDKVGK